MTYQNVCKQGWDGSDISSGQVIQVGMWCGGGSFHPGNNQPFCRHIVQVESAYGTVEPYRYIQWFREVRGERNEEALFSVLPSSMPNKGSKQWDQPCPDEEYAN